MFSIFMAQVALYSGYNSGKPWGDWSQLSEEYLEVASIMWNV